MKDAFEARFIELGRGTIEFRRPNLRELAKGTPLEGNDGVLTMGDNLVVSHRNKRPRQLANMFRTLILHNMGGIWVDTVRTNPSASWATSGTGRSSTDGRCVLGSATLVFVVLFFDDDIRPPQ